jgi:hypothetical protein
MAEVAIKKTVPGIRVRTAQTGFRRGGREWSGSMEVPVSEFTKEQLSQIRAEPLLVVEDIEIGQETDAGNEAADDSVGADSFAPVDKSKSGGKKPGKAKPESDGKITGLRITSSVDGFQCAGREWTGVTDVPAVDLSVEQVNQIMGAPELVVTDLLIDADSNEKG